MFLCLFGNASEIFQWGSLLSPQCCHGRRLFLPLRDSRFRGELHRKSSARRRAFRFLAAEGADATEAERLLACWTAAYSFFAKRLAVAQGA